MGSAYVLYVMVQSTQDASRCVYLVYCALIGILRQAFVKGDLQNNYIAAGLVTHTTTFRELTLRELRPVRVPAPRGLSVPAGVASLRPAHEGHFSIG